MYTTYGFPPELLEQIGAERNLQLDWAGFSQQMEEHGMETGGGKVADVFTHSPVDSLAKAMEPTNFLGYETDRIAGQSRRHHRPRSSCAKCMRGNRPRAAGDRGARSNAVLRRIWAARSATRGEIVAPGFRFEVIDTQRKKASCCTAAICAKAC